MKNTVLDNKKDYTINPNLKANPKIVDRKMAIAVAFIEKHGLPEDLKTPQKTKKKKNQSPPLTLLQKELLEVYALEPDEQQMLELKTFLEQLFSEKKPIQQETQEEMTALAA